jgi:hypothetical protein
MSKPSGWIQAIQEMLREGIAVPDAELREDDPGSTCKPVKLRRSGKSLVVSLNAKLSFKAKAEPVNIKDRLFPLFREQEGVTRISDYWIFCEQEGEDRTPVLYVLVCELKSGKPDGLAQLDNAKLLAEYFVKMVKHHREVSGEVRYRGIVFSHKYLAPKAGLRPGKTVYTSETQLKLPVAYLRDGGECQLSYLCA